MALKCRTAAAMVICTAPFVATIVTLSQSTAAPKIPTGKVKNYVGQVVTVCAKVITYGCDDGATTLDLEKAYWNNPVRILISKEARARFPPRLEDRYVFADVCVTGVVERRDKRHDIVAERPEHITVMKEAPAFVYRQDAVRACDGAVEMPTVIKEVKPSYTERATRGRQQGIVLIEAVVGTDGQVGEGRVLVGFETWTGLNDEAAKAVRQWRFKPGTVDGHPAPVIALIEMTFTLK